MSKDLGGDDKWFLAFMSVASVIIGLLVVAVVIMILVAIWQAGLTNFLWILGIGSIITWLSRIVYRAALKNDWIEKF